MSNEQRAKSAKPQQTQLHLMHLFKNRFSLISLKALAFCAAFTGPIFPCAHADSLDALSQFMRATQSGRAHFTQTVTSPSKEGRKARVKNSEGTFTFLRPQRFRFEYEKPFPQTIVADGQTLWLYDPDIAQVTARQQAKALGSTPASLIASAPDLSALEKDFILSAESPTDQLQWVIATPRAQDSQLQLVRIGLSVGLSVGPASGTPTSPSPNTQQVQLTKLEIWDAFGQKSVMSFDKFEVNPTSINASSFKFTSPPGVETIRP